VALLLRQVSSALAAAHRRNIVHRDVKPENIVLVPKGGSFQAKVLDFGLAKTPDQGHLTHSGMIVGTPRYMSPEQAQSGLVDRRSDLYSLACVAFFALTGEHVVTATEVVDVLMEVVRGEPRPPSELVPGLPGEVDRLFQAALAKDPRRRPADLEAWAGRLADELEASLGTCTGWDVPRLARVRTPEPGSAGDGDETAVSPVARLGKLRAAEPPPSS
jgi:serine/threonine-protein kinase